MRKILSIGIITAICNFGCSQGFEVASTLEKNEGSSGEESSPVTRPPPNTVPDTNLKICSKLDFAGVIWPSGFKSTEQKAMALALNITGSFEGSGGWENLANNFDGQGISLGLNQQNLGQGSLQPIFKKMLEDENQIAKMLFSTTNLKSMTAMVNAWSQSGLVETNSSEGSELFPEREALSPLDSGFEPTVSILASRNANSVSWAVANVFQRDGSTFRPEWKQSLRSFAATAPYRSLQVEAAADMFDRATSYFFRLGFRELRSLLLMYDVVVQNGGFNSDHLAKFKNFNASNPKASETARLLKLLEIRLVSVRTQYRADVVSRKQTIINGVGRVHGKVRELQREYCFQPTEVISTGPNFSQP